MYVVEFSAERRALPQAAHRLCSDPSAWPRIVPACRAARVVGRDGTRELIALTTSRGGSLRTWQAWFRSRIEFGVIEIEAAPSSTWLRKVQSTWRFESDAAGTRLGVSQRFEVDESAFSSARSWSDGLWYTLGWLERETEVVLTALGNALVDPARCNLCQREPAAVAPSV